MVLTETGRARYNPVYRNMFSQSLMSDATLEERAWFDEFQRLTTSPANVVRFLEAFADARRQTQLSEGSMTDAGGAFTARSAVPSRYRC